jgi:hypothetical protein
LGCYHNKHHYIKHDADGQTVVPTLDSREKGAYTGAVRGKDNSVWIQEGLNGKVQEKRG